MLVQSTGGAGSAEFGVRHSQSASLTNANDVVQCQQVARGRHPKNDIAQALDYAEKNGWIVEMTVSGRRWGVARCGRGCSISIWSTPKSPGNHANAIRRAVHYCPHGGEEEQDDE